MIDKRHKNSNWALPTDVKGNIETWDGVKVAVLMDIRDELQTLNRLLSCPNFTRIPYTLREIEANTKKHLRKKKPGLTKAGKTP